MRKSVRKILIINFTVMVVILAGLELVLKLNSNRDFKNSFNEYAQHITFDYNAFTAAENALFGPVVSNPFFGHTLSPQRGSNNLGFDNQFDIPYKPKENELVIGVFGASVAQGLGRFLSDRLKEEKVNVCQKTNSIKVINFALGAYRQPQQFNVFHAFADQLDFAINMDGNNDIIHRGGPGYPLFYPTFFVDLYLLTKDKISVHQNTYKYQSWQRKIIEISEKFKFLNRSELYYRLNIVALKILQDRVNETRARLDKMTGPLPFESMSEQDPQAIKLWVKYIKLQNLVAKQYELPVIFYVQPTQYIENSKIMGADELNTAIVARAHEAERRRLQWARLAKEIPELKKSGINILDYTKIFKDISKPIFIDDCCHFNNEGFEFIMEKVISDIKANLSKVNCSKYNARRSN